MALVVEIQNSTNEMGVLFLVLPLVYNRFDWIVDKKHITNSCLSY